MICSFFHSALATVVPVRIALAVLRESRWKYFNRHDGRSKRGNNDLKQTHQQRLSSSFVVSFVPPHHYTSASRWMFIPAMPSSGVLGCPICRVLRWPICRDCESELFREWVRAWFDKSFRVSQLSFFWVPSTSFTPFYHL